MRIFITGNMGYVGPPLVRHLREVVPGAQLVGYDNAYFAHCLTGATTLPEHLLDDQQFGDVRDILREALVGFDAVIHLAAVSNDPMGNRFETVTEDINQAASVRLATLARDAGVKAFVFASSCSVYGVAQGPARREEDPLNPVTAYARSKVGTEVGLRALDAPHMAVTCLRFATACGFSDRLRLDLVLNDFVACALSSGAVTVLSDGTPWRPLIDVADMARALEWGAARRVGDGDRFVIVNVSTDTANYQVKDLAQAVADVIPGTRVSINTDAPADSRSYKVDFSRFRELAPEHQPQLDLHASIVRLRDGLSGMGFDNADFRTSAFMRLKVLDQHLTAGRLTEALRWA